MMEFVKMEAAERARTAKEVAVVKKLLAQTNLSDEEIADIAEVSLTFVEEVREGKKPA